MEAKIIKLQENVNTNKNRIERVEKKIEKIEDTCKIVEKMDYKISSLEQNSSEIQKKIEDFYSAKGNKWDKLIDYIFYTVLAYCLYKLGIR